MLILCGIFDNSGKLHGDPETAPVTPTSWYYNPCITLSASVWAGPRESCNEQNTAKAIGHHFHHWVTKRLWVPSWVPYEEAHMARNQGRPPAKSKQVTEALCPGTCKEPDPASRHVSDLGSGPSPSAAFRWDQSPSPLDSNLERPWARGPS